MNKKVKSYSKGNCKGFTIFELLVSIAIIAVLSGIALLSYNGFRERYNIESQTKEMYIDLMNARVRAMQRNRVHFFVLETFVGSTRYTIYEDTHPGPDGDGAQTANDTVWVQKTQNSPYDIKLSAGTQIIIEANGLISSGKCSVYANKSTASEYDCLSILPTRINMGKWNGTCKEK